MKTEDLEYIKSALEFCLENGIFVDHDVETSFNFVTNSINVIQEEQSKRTVTDEEIEKKYPITGALHGEVGLYKLTNNASRDGAKWMRDQLTKQDKICTDTGKICKYNCFGLCKERC